MTDPVEIHIQQRSAWALENASFARRRRSRNGFFHSEVNRLIASQVSPNSYVLDVGSSDGATLASCEPLQAVGIDLDAIALAESQDGLESITTIASAVEHVSRLPYPHPDFILLSMVLDEVYDAQSVIRQVASWMKPESRAIIVTYSRLWRPLIRLAEMLKLKIRPEGENYLPWDQVENMLELEGFEVTKRLDGVLVPIHIPGLSRLINRWIAPLPLFRSLSLVRVTTARRIRPVPEPIKSVSIVVAARNEAGHIPELVKRVPILAPRQELIFVEGNSTDNTWEVILRECELYDRDSRMTLHAFQQPGQGKGDAVREGFNRATGDVLMILDADLSVPPEELPRFINALENDRCEFANGSRLVYPMDDSAMRFLNLLGNRFFSHIFTYLLGQSVRDTLCGTKVIRREAYDRIQSRRSVFGNFDPFGDFDLLFGASLLGLRIRDIPIHYKERTYGSSNIPRFRSGWMLLRMSRVAAIRLKFVG